MNCRVPLEGWQCSVQRETEGEGGTTDDRAQRRRNGATGHPVCPRLKGFQKPGSPGHTGMLGHSQRLEELAGRALRGRGETKQVKG